jgi:hypothetical protein
MALARVVLFDNVDSAHMEQLVRQVESDPQPDDIPAAEFVMLHDADSRTAMAVIFFDDEESYAKADAALNAMPADETPGRRTSVTKYRVLGRITP